MLLLNKITKLKAIHNLIDTRPRIYYGAFTEQNYKIESNSQLIPSFYIIIIGAFTEQNYKIESNSQLQQCSALTVFWCFYWTKLQNWKQFTTKTW